MKYILFLFCIILSLNSHGVKMHPGIVKVKQPDGTTITVRAWGNHDFSYYTTIDGVLLYKSGFAFYIADIEDDGILYPTNYIAHDKEERSHEEKLIIEKQNKTIFYDKISANSNKAQLLREPIENNTTLLQSFGSPRVPVILVEFSDSTFKVNNPAKTFDKYLNAEELFNQTNDPEMGKNYGSVKRYFTDMSFGKFIPEFDVYGPVTLDKPLKYYGGGYSSSENMNDLFKDACTAIDDTVDFSGYDANNDGNIDLVYIIYAGYSQSWAGNSTDCIHPKSGILTNNMYLDGKRLCRYGVNNELNATPADQIKNGLLINGIGLFCHEFSHCLGLPDMYPAPGSIAERCINQNLDYWDLMDAGEYTQNGYRPTEYTSWERERLGWMTIDTLKSPCDATLKTLSDGGKAYRILNDKDVTGNEYYIVENVQKKGWNRYLQGHGMLIYHVDYDDYYFSLGGCKVNNMAGHPRMSVIAADGIFMPEYFVYSVVNEDYMNNMEKIYNQALINKYSYTYITTDIYKEELQGDPFPGINNVTSLTDDTSPSASVYSGGFMSKPITDISEDTDMGTVSFKFMGGKPNGIENINDKIQSNMIYSVCGQYLGTDITILNRGIYIINNKKVIKR